MLTIQHYRGPKIVHDEPAAVKVKFLGYSLHHFRANVVFPRPIDSSIAHIQRVVAQYYGLSMSEMRSAQRARAVARPRQVAMYLCKFHTKRSLTEIGKKFDRDHTTVIHAVRQIERLRLSNEDIAGDLTTLRRTLGAA